MSLSNRTPEATPVCQVPAFAESVRARVRLAVSAAHPLRLSTARLGAPEPGLQGPSPMERVFRRPAGAARGPTSVVRGGPVRLDAHLHVRLAIERRLETRTVWRREPAPRVHGERGAPPAPTTTPTVRLAPRTSGRVASEGLAPAAVVTTAVVSTHRPAPVAAPRQAAYGHAAEGPPAVPQVHRTSQSPTPETVAPQSDRDAVPMRVLAHWEGEERSGSAPASLTASDLPVVVDHVVREIDRRVVAARERRGWAP